MEAVTVIGAGLAGCEAAWQLARRGIPVRLVEMKPDKKSPAHVSGNFAELVCSNSLRSDDLTNAVGLLKQEMRLLGSLIMDCAEATKVAAGGALAVDREGFSQLVTEKIRSCENIEIISKEQRDIPQGEVIIATGPLTSDAFAEKIKTLFPDEKFLNFYDAAAPLVSLQSIDMDSAFYASRYDKGTADYVNCPMTKEEYLDFWQELFSARQAQLHGFDDGGVFEGCMPLEVMAKRGFDTLTYGPLKPVGLEKDNKPFAVVQLRQDDALKSMYNMVGFQTNLKFGEQRRIIKMIPGLENANILRYGVMHQNTYFNSPKVLNACYQVKDLPNVFIAGQLSGVEGYVESASSGLSCAYHMYRHLNNLELTPFPNTTIIGALAHYIATPNSKFNPMNANLGLLSPLEKHKKSQRRQLYHTRSIETLKDYLNG